MSDNNNPSWHIEAQAVCVGLVCLMSGLAWRSAFSWEPLLWETVLAVLVPAATVILLSRARPHAVAAPVVISFVLLGWFLSVVVLRDSFGVLFPSSGSIGAVWHDIVNDWAVMLSTPLPEPATGQLLVLPVVVTWIATIFGVELVLRTRRPMTGTIPGMAAFVLALVFGVGGPGPVLAMALVLACAVAVLSALSVHPDLQVAQRSGRKVTIRRFVEVAACIAALGLGAALLGPALPGVSSANPYNPRVSRVPPQQLEAVLNPLDQLSTWAQSPSESLLEVHTDRPQLLRVAVLDNYNALNGWTSSNQYEATGATLASDVTGRTTGSEKITIQGLPSPWLPAPVQPSRITGVKPYVNPSTGVLITTGRHAALTYDVTYRTPAGYLTSSSTPVCAFDAALPPSSSVVVPGFISQAAQQYTNTATSPCERAEQLVQAFSQHFSFDAKAPSGSSLQVLQNFVQGSKATLGGEGTEEQFAAAYALMAESLDMDARVVVGFYPGEKVAPDTYKVGPQDATAWVEINFANVGWVPFFPKPARGGTPSQQEQSETTTQIPVVASPGESGGNGPQVREVLVPRVQSLDGWVVVGLVLLIAVGLLCLGALTSWVAIALALRRRLRSRRAQTDPRRRVLAAWDETVDVLSEAGLRRRHSETASQLVTVGTARLGGESGDSLAPLAELANAAQYSLEEPGVDDADRAWRCADDVSTFARAALDRRGRVRRALDIRSLFSRSG